MGYFFYIIGNYMGMFRYYKRTRRRIFARYKKVHPMQRPVMRRRQAMRPWR
jgi:hypothetical protein